MDFKAYQDAARSTAVYPDGARVVYPALGLASEAGEVAGKIKKAIRDKGSNLDATTRAAIADELGDVLWYVSVLAGDLGYTLEQVAAANLTKLADRKVRDVIRGDGDNR